MNVLGHAYIATKTVRGKRDLLIIGSLLPESFPFIAGDLFNFEEIHEGGEKLLDFLSRNYPDKRDLALGMLAHSAKFGADGFNKEIEKYAGQTEEELLGKIATCSGLDLKTAKYRLHNFLWWGVDILILENYSEIAEEVRSAVENVDIEEVSRLLAESLARIWSRQAAGLPEKDKVDVPRTLEVMKECAGILENNWREIVTEVEEGVRGNLESFVASNEGRTRWNRERVV